MSAAPLPPMPLAIDALLTDSSDSAGDSEHVSESNLSTTNHRSAIDYNKFRTRMCHYFLIDKPCPFGERCAFAHGEAQINTPMPQAALERLLHNQSHHMRQPNSGYTSPLSPSYPRGQSFVGHSSRHTNAFNAPIHHMHQSVHGSSNVTRVNSMNDHSPSSIGSSLAIGLLSTSSSFAHLPPPPAYSDHVGHDAQRMLSLSGMIKAMTANELSASCEAGVLHECPNRFRYDPYSPRGFVLSASA